MCVLGNMTLFYLFSQIYLQKDKHTCYVIIIHSMNPGYKLEYVLPAFLYRVENIIRTEKT